MESMVLTASEAELLKGNANLIELLPAYVKVQNDEVYSTQVFLNVVKKTAD